MINWRPFLLLGMLVHLSVFITYINELLEVYCTFCAVIIAVQSV